MSRETFLRLRIFLILSWGLFVHESAAIFRKKWHLCDRVIYRKNFGDVKSGIGSESNFSSPANDYLRSSGSSDPYDSSGRNEWSNTKHDKPLRPMPMGSVLDHFLSSYTTPFPARSPQKRTMDWKTKFKSVLDRTKLRLKNSKMDSIIVEKQPWSLFPFSTTPCLTKNSSPNALDNSTGVNSTGGSYPCVTDISDGSTAGGGRTCPTKATCPSSTKPRNCTANQANQTARYEVNFSTTPTADTDSGYTFSISGGPCKSDKPSTQALTNLTKAIGEVGASTCKDLQKPTKATDCTIKSTKAGPCANNAQVTVYPTGTVCSVSTVILKTLEEWNPLNIFAPTVNPTSANDAFPCTRPPFRQSQYRRKPNGSKNPICPTRIGTSIVGRFRSSSDELADFFEKLEACRFPKINSF